MKLKALVLSCAVALPCHALQTYKLVDHQKTQAVISNKQHTRIAVFDDRIQQIFGAEGQFDVESDEEQGQIFLKPLVPDASAPISITIVTENGLTQDLRLSPKDIEAQSILLRPTLTEFEPVVEKKSRLEDISELMRVMIQDGSHEAYDKSPLQGVDRDMTSSYKMEPVSIYRGVTYTGKVYKLTNDSEMPLACCESIFAAHAKEQKDAAIYIANKNLEPQQQTYVFIVSQERGLS